MLEKLARKRKFLAYGTGGLILIQWLLMFLPYYSYGDGQTSSISGYIWLNFDEMKDYWRSVIPGYAINNEFLVPFALFFICLVAAIFCFTMPKEWFTHVIAFVWAVIGLLGFPFTKTLHFGNIYWVHYIIFIVGALSIAFSWFLDVYAEKQIKLFCQHGQHHEKPRSPKIRRPFFFFNVYLKLETDTVKNIFAIWFRQIVI